MDQKVDSAEPASAGRFLTRARDLRHPPSDVRSFECLHREENVRCRAVCLHAARPCPQNARADRRERACVVGRRCPARSWWMPAPPGAVAHHTGVAVLFTSTRHQKPLPPLCACKQALQPFGSPHRVAVGRAARARGRPAVRPARTARRAGGARRAPAPPRPGSPPFAAAPHARPRSRPRPSFSW